MSLFTNPAFDDHEQVVFCRDAAAGLLGIIAIHNTNLGPAAGGCRMYPYASEDDALTDVLRLSRGMSYKSAIAGLPLGGGKSVIIGDPSLPSKHDLLRAFSRHIQALGGRYWAAIDVGVSPHDADILGEHCDYVFARASRNVGGLDTSQYTALGGFVGIQAIAEHRWHHKDLTGLRVAIQGLGATGRDLARRLHEAGANLFVADVKDDAVNYAVQQYGAKPVDPDWIHMHEVEVFAPCAMGAVVNDATLPEIAAKAICGLANNQLAEARHGEALRARGITYVPDYVVNGGGIIAAGQAIYSSPTPESEENSVLQLRETVLSVLAKADAEGRSPADVADEMARARLVQAG